MYKTFLKKSLLYFTISTHEIQAKRAQAPVYCEQLCDATLLAVNQSAPGYSGQEDMFLSHDRNQRLQDEKNSSKLFNRGNFYFFQAFVYF